MPSCPVNWPSTCANWGTTPFHTQELPQGNRTSDHDICEQADSAGAIVVTKDNDFVINRIHQGRPKRLLVILTGNITNWDLLTLIENNLGHLETVFSTHTHVELSRSTLTIHD